MKIKIIFALIISGMVMPEAGHSRSVGPTQQEWLDELTQLTIDKIKLDRQFMYCIIDINYFSEPLSVYCLSARAQMNILAFENNLPLIPKDDVELFKQLISNYDRRMREISNER
ncbi:MAG: hypothetical protein JWL86_5741 [Rhizobium sp.]|nr:hypothetical protein [Rhizobium sp.]